MIYLMTKKSEIELFADDIKLLVRPLVNEIK